MIRPCDAPGCDEPAGLFVRVIPPVPAGLAPVVYLCTADATTYVAALARVWHADAAVTSW